MKALSIAELEQVITYIRWAESDGAYYGRRDYFDQRHKKIKEYFEKQLKESK